ncbi:MAG: DUF84 family protein [Bacilli bacterium]
MTVKSLAVGTKNKPKNDAVCTVFSPDYTLISLDVPSGVAAQPLGDEETKKGAYNRAVAAKRESGAYCGIGLEGGVAKTKEGLFLTSWACFVDNNETPYYAGTYAVSLPSDWWEELQQGTELHVLVERYTNQLGVSQKEGAVGIFSAGRITRTELFAHLCALVRGAYEHTTKKEGIK